MIVSRKAGGAVPTITTGFIVISNKKYLVILS